MQPIFMVYCTSFCRDKTSSKAVEQNFCSSKCNSEQDHSSFSHTHVDHNAPCPPPPPPNHKKKKKKWHNHCFNFSWVLQSSKEKSKTWMIMQRQRWLKKIVPSYFWFCRQLFWSEASYDIFATSKWYYINFSLLLRDTLHFTWHFTLLTVLKMLRGDTV